MSKLVRIGSRESPLAMAQAYIAEQLIGEKGYNTAITGIKSLGDKNLVTPLYEMGVEGVFTKELDSALLNNEIDLAVHSYKDVPTQPAAGLCVAAVLERASPWDVLVCKNEATLSKLNEQQPLQVASSSIRRKAQWLYRYPASTLHNIRGNVGTRLQKLQQEDLDAVIFAQAGLARLRLTAHETGPQLLLNWMLPAPAQGAIAILCRETDTAMLHLGQLINHEASSCCTEAEKKLLRQMGGGCASPIAAYAQTDKDILTLQASITAADGSRQYFTEVKGSAASPSEIAILAAQQLKAAGAYQLLVK